MVELTNITISLLLLTFRLSCSSYLINQTSYQVAPAELEALLLTHHAIADVGVIGVWSERDGSEVPRYVRDRTEHPCRVDTMIHSN